MRMESLGVFQVILFLVLVTGAMYMILYENQDKVYRLFGLAHHHRHNSAEDLQVSYKYRQRSHPKRTYLYEHPNKNVKTYVKEDIALKQKENLVLKVKKGNRGRRPFRKSQTSYNSSASLGTLDLDSIGSMGDVLNFFKGKTKPGGAMKEGVKDDVGFDEEEKYDPPHIIDVVDEFGLSVKAYADE